MKVEIVQFVVNHDKEYGKKPQEIDYDLIANDRAERYQRDLQRRLALCGSRTYPSVYARQDILNAEQERNRLMGIDISDKEDGE